MEQRGVEKNVGDYIRQLRISKGLSQKDIAGALEIDFTLVSKIELGERTLSLDMVPNLARALKMEFRTLQIDLMAFRVAEDYGQEEFASEALKKALKQIAQDLK